MRLGVTPAAVSRAVARHEAALGVTLFRRTTRSVQLTDAGQRYYLRCRQALAMLDDAERAIADEQREPRGLVRMSVPTTYGHYRVLPLLDELTTRYPAVTLEVNVANTNVDVVAEQYDLAVRMGELADSSLAVRPLEDAAIGVYASPRYLALRGEPRDPASLGEHRCIAFVRPSTGRALPWRFRGSDGGVENHAVPEALRCSGDVLACVTLARAGAGLVQTYGFVVEEDLRAGRLVEVLRPYGGVTNRFSLLQPPGKRPLAARLVAEFLRTRVAGAAGQTR